VETCRVLIVKLRGQSFGTAGSRWQRSRGIVQDFDDLALPYGGPDRAAPPGPRAIIVYVRGFDHHGVLAERLSQATLLAEAVLNVVQTGDDPFWGSVVDRTGGTVVRTAASQSVESYAGHAGSTEYDDPTTGRLLIVIFGPDDVHGKMLDVPGKGPLRIIAETDNTLTITSVADSFAGGREHTLDIVTLQLS
jgi:hypothetical protein